MKSGILFTFDCKVDGVAGSGPAPRMHRAEGAYEPKTFFLNNYSIDVIICNRLGEKLICHLPMSTDILKLT